MMIKHIHMNDDYGQFIDISENSNIPNKINNPTTIHPTNIHPINNKINLKPKQKQKRICIHFFNYNFILGYNHIVYLFIVGSLLYGTKIYYFKW